MIGEIPADKINAKNILHSIWSITANLYNKEQRITVIALKSRRFNKKYTFNFGKMAQNSGK